jgi:carbamate kinase
MFARLSNRTLAIQIVNTTQIPIPAAQFLSTRKYSPMNDSRPHIIVAIGGNALLKRGERLTQENQQSNASQGMKGLSQVVKDYSVTLVHGNGPQVGLLALEGDAYWRQTGNKPMNFDVLDAETEGMIGYLLEKEIQSYLPDGIGSATMLSQIVVDAKDPAFQDPSKYIGPMLTEEEAKATGLPCKQDGNTYWRRVVPSPLPLKLLDSQMTALRILKRHGCFVVCAGGGGIPVIVETNDNGRYTIKGVEAVIDKDRAACMLGVNLHAHGLLILTDVQGVAINFGTPSQKWIKAASPQALRSFNFPAGSMGPKVESAIEFVEKTGGWSAIGSLSETAAILRGEAGTRVDCGPPDFIEYYKDKDMLSV